MSLKLSPKCLVTAYLKKSGTRAATSHGHEAKWEAQLVIWMLTWMFLVSPLQYVPSLCYTKQDQWHAIKPERQKLPSLRLQTHSLSLSFSCMVMACRSSDVGSIFSHKKPCCTSMVALWIFACPSQDLNFSSSFCGTLEFAVTKHFGDTFSDTLYCFS